MRIALSSVASIKETAPFAQAPFDWLEGTSAEQAVQEMESQASTWKMILSKLMAPRKTLAGTTSTPG